MSFKTKLSSFLPLISLFIFSFSCTPKINPESKNEKFSTQQDFSKNNSDLAKYVYTPDDAFSYEVVNTLPGDGYTTYIVKMVSQVWLDKSVVKRPEWWHWVTIVVPESVKSNTGLLLISGGSHKSDQPEKPDDVLVKLAQASNSIVSKIHNVPNQPTEFVGDDYGPRVEDEIISYGWRQFLEKGADSKDAHWLARFPMTKAAVRAMDVITEVTSSDKINNPVNEFVVTGASKRGWTTWTTGAVDERVVAIAPIVIDLLNMVPSFKHHWRAYGRWADAIHDYEYEGIMEWQNSEEYHQLTLQTEPYSFLNDLKIPKLLLWASGDQFFLPDSWQFYWDDLKGEKHLRYVPNSEHSMKETDVVETLAAFFQMIVAQKERPDFDWEVKNGEIHIQTNKEFIPESITLWEAHNPNGRNFQVTEIGRAYEPSNIPISADGKYTIKIDQPEEGYSAFFAELKFPGLGSVPLKLSTGIVVTPDTYPYPPYESEDPMGTPMD